MIAPLFPPEELRGCRVADIGSGSGRIVRMLVALGASHVIAVEPSSAFEVLEANTVDLRDQVTYLNVRGEDLPGDKALDFVFSIGVIHHIPDPAPTLLAAYDALRPGGRVVLWLYGREGNELYLAIVRPIRLITSRLPPGFLLLLSRALALPLAVYVRACAWLPLPLRNYARSHLLKLTRRQLVATIYDQLKPAYAKYYAHEEAVSLVESAGFTDARLHHRHGYSWTVVAVKPE